MTKEKLCKDCKWRRFSILSLFGENFDKCLNPIITKEKIEMCLITGKNKEMKKTEYCETQRDNDIGDCKEQGIYWKKKK